MARPKVSMSQRIRDVLADNPDLTGPEIISTLAAKGFRAKPALVYYVKAHVRAKKRRQTRQKVEKVVSSNGSLDPLAVIVKVKGLAAEVGGIKKLKELVEALS
jgi:hypothetical protein